MLQKLKVTLLAAAMPMIVLAPTAKAAEVAMLPMKQEIVCTEEENCLKDIWSFWDRMLNCKFDIPVFRNGFVLEEGKLVHYTKNQLDVYPAGFVTIEEELYHVSVEGSEIDAYPLGFVTIDGKLYHVSTENGAFDRYPAGFVTIDGNLYRVAAEGCSIENAPAGLQEIDGGMYYGKGDGSLLTGSAVGHLTFGDDGRYTSGNAALDGYVDAALAVCTTSNMTAAQKLHAAYLYVRDHGAYLAQPHQARGSTGWAEESAVFMFEHGKGNCYCFAGQFMYMARRLGFDAYVVSGGVGNKNSDHAWVMIHENGIPYIYDVELEWGYRAGKYGKADYDLYKMPLDKTVFTYHFPS